MSVPDPAERDLVEEAKVSPEAFGRLYDRHFPRIYSYIVRRVGNREVAEDLTSETFFKALSHIRKYEYTGLPFAAWLYRIAGNVVADYYRRQRPDQPLDTEMPLPAPGDGPEEWVLRLDQRQTVLEAVSQLTPEQQDVVLLRFEHGFRLKEIAGICGKTEGAVKALMFRALHTLKQRLAESGVRA